VRCSFTNRSALQNVKKGDSVTVELALKDNGPAPKTK
jgi:hypothetical protein